MSVGLLIFTIVHVIISLVGIATGFVVIYGFLTAKRLNLWTGLFLVFTILTSVTGFMFPVDHFTPGHAIGILSLILLAIAVAARYPMQMAGHWRTTYVVTAMIAQYFNFVVLIIQSFQKVTALEALAAMQGELIAQLAALALFVSLTIAAAIRFRIESVHQPNELTKSAALS